MTARTKLCGTLCALAALSIPFLALAQNTRSDQSAAEIQKQIDDHNAEIAQLNKEIAQYQAQLDVTSAKKQTLQNTVNQLNLSIKKITASIGVTKNQISAIQLQIQQLSKGIAGKQASINSDESGLAESLRRINELETRSLVSQMLSAEDISGAWQDVDAIRSLQNSINEQIAVLGREKQSLTDIKTATEAKRVELVKQQDALLVQQGSLNAAKRAQSDLLTQTKSQESTYQAIIAQKKAQEASFEQALSDLQAKLQVAVNPSQITPGGKGILQWPLDSVQVTQYFGNTPFAQSGAYSGKGHNGIDLRASIGTPVKAALSGTILGTGNTDAIRGCYSYGKWVLIKHGNGLDTLYAHLSQISISEGQPVSTGQVIGFSGATGYATGPHLHFGVYVSSATQIIRLGEATNKKTSCANAIMPVAPLPGYLNPLNYL